MLIQTLGYIKYSSDSYPFLKITTNNNSSKRVLISGGIHGDEPAGVEAICQFIEKRKYQPFLNEWEFTFLPCINPYGYEYNQRENKDDIDLNRMFKVQHPPLEVKLSKSTFKSSYFNLTIELHEDIDSSGYYIFQKSNRPFGMKLGYKILDAASKVIPINSNKIIDDLKSENGLIHKTKEINEMEWWPMAGYSLAMKTDHCFTLETPTKLPIQIRTKAHLSALKNALNEYKN